MLRPLWRCPRCGHELVTRKMSHSCKRYTLRHHFADKPASVRALFDEYVAAVRACGPFTIEPQKTRIAFLVRVRFAAGHPLKTGFRGHLWLTQAHPGPPVERIEHLTPTCFLHHFFLSTSDINDAFRARIAMAYRVGCQDHIAKGRRAPTLGGRRSRTL